ncbi:MULTISPECIES: trifunctional transcriptional regulator/proline dehydrogenase/L-glutamate gamma-semialdehyde dehydrogenase [unclassified Polaromonas]|uniref:trifunctional transcriptional regulator/proline dehydrogenase/L-glutamate gamma-semialdehyde dehydrogenase n=1 Tax=unclassified Polaromonas TaxID=2638319 RepID=UPI0018C9DBB4|nr:MULTISPECIES: trifunctional transcriptional regulator/proline dehydrogenase/L-glutamate gamma-semialdehyde dehydrogenase [unclassified Polaromonas]MBG6071373.1 RHH-type proline utilization regulon transcriptional repressor/proline dehydrogenase/delta 1-pyrroline-5-carboxylate dehydrogenase [Polaromonas sp. CG_9.7]MBG6113373.1 RHH-type proline utilization regulon transcriptional repressor/proline dehydrogenase/delta 1-pyrroline-5-carboxylate dehydrogenase [Polaromonas sp. CG_9.2]MDH6183169.1 R
MSTVTLGLKVDETLRDRIREAAAQQGRAPHWLIKQAVLQYVESLERGLSPLGATPGATGLAELAESEEADDPALVASVGHPAPPFLDWAQNVLPQTDLRAAITAAWHRPEEECLPLLVQLAHAADATQRTAIETLATRLVEGLRGRQDTGGVEALVQEFSLSSQEGVALMCLAEALLRIPDNATRDALIRDKISRGDWHAHLGNSPSMFVNAAVWGLMLTGKLTSTSSEKSLASSLTRLIGKGGEPLIRQGVHRAMKLMGEQFVTGQTISEALANSRSLEKAGFRYSYDMLGEAAITEQDAERYLASYEQAIHAIGKASHGRGIHEGPGISVKLSALHPRYSRAQRDRVMGELLPRLLQLALLARQYDIGLNIDAEEADRLELSLDLLESLCFEPALKGWNGIGFVVQAYLKRCPYVIDHLIDLGRRSSHRLMIRLVKGAYWDSEIKRAQLDGLDGYPVYTRKVHTDVSYLACARKLLAAPDAVYPQFATHNAQTVASIYHMAGNNYYSGQYEFQCLHGMGEPLYDQVTGSVADGKLARPCRIYAPVGTHETLLAYLVRRLLENGANTSFVNRIGDANVPVAELVVDPVAEVRQIERDTGHLGAPHPKIPLPRQMFADLGAQSRLNSSGLNLANEQQLASLSAGLLRSTQGIYTACAGGTGVSSFSINSAAADGWQPVLNPADTRDQVGWVRPATSQDVEQAVSRAARAAQIWHGTPPQERAACLTRAADVLEQRTQSVLGLIVREAGKSLPNAIAEVREAVDFLRYYAAQVAATFDNDTHRPLGVVLCISPWNFPLAIFAGQVAAALASGNCALAKPAEQTPLVADVMVRILHEAGVPVDAVQLVPGTGDTVGAALVAHRQVAGVMFTGSTEVSRLIAQTLAKRLSPQGHPIALIAETGGQNALVADSSALAEQLVDDVLSSAFDSAGQRCSALRLLCLQEDGAERVVDMVKHAMREWVMGNPDRMHTDVGPVIDEDARAQIEQHIAQMQAEGQRVTRMGRDESAAQGHFVMPALIEIDSIERLKREVFGPVLHVLRYRRDQLGKVLDALNATGYGLTFGVHSRIDETIAQVTQKVQAGNIYVNRNVIGAVVGVQPFGGMGLSGTGPKAGGPLYLYRLLQAGPAQGNQALAMLPAMPVSRGAAPVAVPKPADLPALRALQILGEALKGPVFLALDGWQTSGDAARAETACNAYRASSVLGQWFTLPGPTGESNRYRLLPRGAVWAVPQTALGLVQQVAAALASGNPCWLETPAAHSPVALALAALPAEVKAFVQTRSAGKLMGETQLSAMLFEGDGDALQALLPRIAEHPGAIVRVENLTSAQLAAGAVYDVSALMHEQSISTNTAAAGGNAQLMTMG